MYRFTLDAGIGLASRVDAVDGEIVDDDTDTPELEGLRWLFGVPHVPLAVATEAALAEHTGDEGGDFGGASEAPELLTMILGAVCGSAESGWLVGRVAGPWGRRAQMGSKTVLSHPPRLRIFD